MKRAAAFLLALLILAAPVYAANVKSPTDDFYVNDYAGVLSGDTESGIIDTSLSLAKETGAQVVVLTVEGLEGMSIQDYGLKVGRSWGIGSKNDNNGVLILLSTGDREIRLEVGYGLEGAINDAKAGRLIDNYAIPYYAEDDFDTGTYELYKAVVSVVREEYGLDSLEGYSTAGQKASSETAELDEWVYIAIIVVFLLFFAVFALSVLYSVIVAVLRLILMPFGIKIPYKKNRVLAFFYLFMITSSNGRRGGGGGSRGGGSRGGGGSFGGGGAGRRF